MTINKKSKVEDILWSQIIQNASYNIKCTIMIWLWDLRPLSLPLGGIVPM